MRVLFVDDEQSVLKALNRTFRQNPKGWDISYVSSGQEALDAFEVEPFDVIVSDMKMPQMQGEELLTVVEEKHPQTARVILSGEYDQASAFERVTAKHFFLAKPCRFELLTETIMQAQALAHQVQVQAMTIQDIQKTMADFVQLLLMKGIINMDAVPEKMKPWLSAQTQACFDKNDLPKDQVQYYQPFHQTAPRFFECDETADKITWADIFNS